MERPVSPFDAAFYSVLGAAVAVTVYAMYGEVLGGTSGVMLGASIGVIAGVVAGVIAGVVEGMRAHTSVRTPIGNIPGGVGGAVGSAVFGAYFLPFIDGSASTIAGFILILIISSISTFWNVKTKG